MTVLIADADQGIRLAVARVLRAAGYACILASTVSEAPALLETSRPDVVVMDLDIPPLLAMEMLAATKPLGGGNARTVVMTSDPGAGADLMTRSGLMKPDAVLVKPFDGHRLLEAVRQK